MIQCNGIWLPDGEEHLIPHIERSPLFGGKGTYQLHKLEMALTYVKQFRRALDVGAHVGTWARVLATRFDHVDAFEPVLEHAECFSANVTAGNVVLHPVALGDKDSEVRLVKYPGNSGHSHIAGVGEVAATMRTLDSYGFGDVDFLKIDTEGFELQVLRGAVVTLERCRPVLIVEQKADNGSRYGYDDRAALPFLQAMGARVVAERARDYVLVWR